MKKLLSAYLIVALVIGYFGYSILTAPKALAAPTLVAHTIAQSSDSMAVTTSAINCTGANFLLLSIVAAPEASYTVSDSSGNTWSHYNQYGGNPIVQLYYVASPTVSSSQTASFSYSASIYPSISFSCWSGMSTTPNDQQNGTNGTNTGNITPTKDGSLIISSNGIAASSPPSFSSGSGATFTKLDSGNFQGGLAYSLEVVYNVQTTATTESITYGVSGELNIGSFLAAPAASTATPHAQVITNNAQIIINKGQTIIN